MKKALLYIVFAIGVLAACNSGNKQTTDKDMEQELLLTQEWDKVFPQSEKVEHSKITFHNRYGITLVADIQR